MALGNMPVAQFPYLVRSYDYGMIICNPKMDSNQQAWTSAWQDDWIITLPGVNKRQIIDYDIQSVTQQWIGESLMRVLHVPGSPFITMNISGPALILESKFLIPPEENEDPQGQTFILHLDDFRTQRQQKWILFSLTGNISVTYDQHSVNIKFPENNPYNVLRLAVIPDSTTENMLELATYRHAIPSTGQVKLEFPEENMGHIIYDWKPVDFAGHPTRSGLLMLGLPHHFNSILNSSIEKRVLTRAYPSSKGKMSGYVSDRWILQEELTTITWHSAGGVDPDKIGAIRYALQQDLTIPPKTFIRKDNDTYSFGKYVSAVARMVLIGQEIGDEALTQKALERLEKDITPWMNRVTYRSTWLYDQTWGGLISADGWLCKGSDYGNGMYNDHHFHNGYYIYAAAVLVQNKPDWPWKDRVIDLIRDIANPSGLDSYFPTTRMKDWYTGHSWAQGLDQTEDGKNQESTAESINAYYGVYLFGLATGNEDMKNIGRLMLATEIRATQKYWHMPLNGNVYEPPFSNNTMVGVMWSDKADYATFFGRNVEYVHCIQMMPFTPISELFMAPKSFIEYEYSILATALTRKGPNGREDLAPEWKAYIYQDWAIFDREKAWKAAVNQIRDDSFRGGNSRSNMYWWIASRPL